MNTPGREIPVPDDGRKHTYVCRIGGERVYVLKSPRRVDYIYEGPEYHKNTKLHFTRSGRSTE